MSKKAIVAEKPSVARQFAKALGITEKHDGYMENDEWVVTWCVGHLVTLSYPDKYDPELEHWRMEDLPFLPKTYKYEVIASSAAQYRIVERILNRNDVSVIYNAGDSGREGEYIQRLVYTMAGVEGKKTILRVWIDSQTDEEILRGIREAKPEAAYDNLYAAAVERAVADYAVGINFSRGMSVRFGWGFNRRIQAKKYTPIAVGRVMTCVLGMIVDREREIRDFKPTDYYKIDAECGNFTAHWKADSSSRFYGSPSLYGDAGFLSKSDADALTAELSKTPILSVEDVKRTNESKSAPLLYNLAELQADCTKRFHISPAETLEIAQSLYEKKLTTYPRTDARVLSSAVAKEIDTNISGLSSLSFASSYVNYILSGKLYSGIGKTRYTNDAKITDHYAIIPTGQTEGYTELPGLERDVYELIVRRFLAIFYPPAQYAKTAVTLRHRNGEPFFTSEKILMVPGYLDVFADDDKNAALPKLGNINQGEEISASFHTTAASTNPPSRYTSGSMILAMENAGKLIEDQELREQIKGNGIGTSATRAETITKLEKIGYIKLNRKTQILTPAPAGEAVYDLVKISIPMMLSPRMTASWEKGLAQVESGEITGRKYRQILEDFVRREIETIRAAHTEAQEKPERKEHGACPICRKPLYETEKAFYCSGWKKDGSGCGFGFPKTIAGHTLTEDETERLIAMKDTDVISDFVGKSGRKFSASLTVDRKTGKVSMKFPSEESSMICPKCGKHLKKGSYYYNCDCGFSFPCEMAHRPFSQEEINTLVKTGKLEKASGFKKKNGDSFEAGVKYSRKDGLSFDFPEYSGGQKKTYSKKSYRGRRAK